MNMEEYLIKISTDEGIKYESCFTTKSLLETMRNLDENHKEYIVYECKLIMDKSKGGI